MKRPLSDKTTREIEAIAQEKGCRLLAVESAGAGRFTVLRLVLERTDGDAVTVEDCERVSRDASAVLDASDEIAHRYTLEVSSAGLDRKLYSLEDAARFVGRRVRVKTESLGDSGGLGAGERKGRGLARARDLAGPKLRRACSRASTAISSRSLMRRIAKSIMSVSAIFDSPGSTSSGRAGTTGAIGRAGLP